MIEKRSISGTIFDILNHLFMIFLIVICLFPLIHIISLSFSDKHAIAGGVVGMLPVDFTTAAYEYVLEKKEFWRAFGVTLKRLVLAVPYHMIMTILMAYPLSKPSSKLYGRSIYCGFLIFCSLFGGGLIPTYMLYGELGLIDTIWVFVIPSSVHIGYVLLMMNFMRGIPSELSEAAYIDGAGEFTTLIRVILPVSKPSIATILLYLIVGNWNDYFSGMIYMNSSSKYPLQTYVYNVIQQASELTKGSSLGSGTGEEWKMLAEITDKSVEAAQIVITIIPILLIYPVLQKHFVKGIVVGSVKG